MTRTDQWGPALTNAELRYFSHSIDGTLYGGWFRHLSPNEVEVFAAGLLKKIVIGAQDPEQAARETLEAFVRHGS